MKKFLKMDSLKGLEVALSKSRDSADRCSSKGAWLLIWSVDKSELPKISVMVSDEGCLPGGWHALSVAEGTVSAINTPSASTAAPAAVLHGVLKMGLFTS